MALSNTKTCPNKGMMVTAMQYPKAYADYKLGKDPALTAMSTTGIADNAWLCRYDDVLGPMRLADLLFVKTDCPDGYTKDPLQISGYNMCKSYLAKPTQPVLDTLPTLARLTTLTPTSSTPAPDTLSKVTDAAKTYYTVGIVCISSLLLFCFVIFSISIGVGASR